MRRIGSLGLAQRIVVIAGLAAALDAFGRYLETIGHYSVSFGWYAYAPLNTSLPTPFKPVSPSVDLAIWGGASVAWALAGFALIGSRLGRRIVLVVASAGVLIALGNYLLTLGNDLNRPGLQFLSSEQKAESGTIDPGGRLEIWLGLAVVWTVAAAILLRPRTRSEQAVR